MKLVRTVIVAFLLAGVVLISRYTYGQQLGAGKGFAMERYSGHIKDGEHYVEFEVKLDPLSFLLNRVYDKYKLVRIVVTGGERRIQLAVKKDEILFSFRTEQVKEIKVPGILDPNAYDPKFWDSLDLKLRRSLAYPKNIGQNEPEIISVLIPAKEVEALRKPEQAIDILPVSIKYKIADLADKTVEIERLTVNPG
jgi:hypothetical protein